MLEEHREKAIAEIFYKTDIPVHQLYASIEKAKELGLVKTRADGSKYPPRNLVSMTPKGKKVADRVNDIRKMLIW